MDSNKNIYTIISIDFSKLNKTELKTAFDNLLKFIEGEDNPVVVVGDFGVPAWKNIFHDFLIKSGLRVKNKIIHSDGISSFNLFNLPSINVLGYDNLGLNAVVFAPKSKMINFQVSF